MAALKLQKLKEIIGRAYEAGYGGCLDLKDEYAEEALVEIVAEIQRAKGNEKGGDWRTYVPDELRKKAVGTMFEHVRLGQGWIEGTSEKNKRMTFSNGDQFFFMQSGEPWDEPMRELGKL
jgi:hypothetical protein